MELSSLPPKSSWKGCDGRFAWLWSLLIIPITFAFFAPIVSAPPHSIPATFDDAWQTVWNCWWVKQWLVGNYPDLYFTPLLFHPFGSSLYLHSLDEGILLISNLIFRHFSPESLFSAACIISFILNGVASTIFFKEFAQKWIVAAACGVLFSFHPYFVGHLQGGHLHLLSFYAPLLFLTAVVRAGSRGVSWKCGAFAAICFGLSVFNDLYGIYFVGLALCPLLLGAFALRIWPVKRTLTQLLLMGILSLVIMSPKVITMHEQMNSGKFGANHRAARYSAALANFVVPGPTLITSEIVPRSLEKLRANINDAGSGAYLGVIVISLMLVSLIRSRNPEYKRSAVFILGAMLFLILSLGPTISLARGSRLGANLIYTVLDRYLPGFPSVPIRFSIMCGLFAFAAIIPLFDYATSLRTRRFNLLCVAPVALLILIDYFPRGVQISRIAPTPAIVRLHWRENIHSVYDTSRSKVLPMVRQIEHRKAIVQGYVARTPLGPSRVINSNAFTKFLITGKARHAGDVFEGWRKLKADALIVNRNQQSLISRINQLKWLRVIDHDSAVLIFGNRS